MYVCIPCRDTMSWTPPGECRRCGRPLVSSPYKWSPPRKNNLRAWKRIAKGEWLWDRRRVRRRPPPAIYDKSNWVRIPGHKKGQSKHFLGQNVPSGKGPDVDLGG